MNRPRHVDDWRSASWLRKKNLSVDRNHGSRSELPGGGVRIPRGGHDFRRPGVGSINQLFVFFPNLTPRFWPLPKHPWYTQRHPKYLYIYINIYIYESTELEPSVSEPRHPFICCLFVRVSKENNVLPNRAQCQKRQTTRKQAVPESEARTLSKTRLRRPLGRPSQRPGRGGATVLFCLRKQNSCMHHATGAFTPRPRVLACSCFVSLRFPAPEQRHDWKNCKQLAHNRQARKRGL